MTSTRLQNCETADWAQLLKQLAPYQKTKTVNVPEGIFVGDLLLSANVVLAGVPGTVLKGTITLKGGSVTLQDLVLMSTKPGQPAVDVREGSHSILNCEVKEGLGVRAMACSSLKVESCLFACETDMEFRDCSVAQILGCSLRFKTLGIRACEDATLKISETMLTGDEGSTGILIEHRAAVQVANSPVSTCAVGIHHLSLSPLMVVVEGEFGLAGSRKALYSHDRSLITIRKEAQRPPMKKGKKNASGMALDDLGLGMDGDIRPLVAYHFKRLDATKKKKVQLHL